MIGHLFSCTSSNKELDETAVLSSDFKQLDTTISFSGCWLSEDYYNSLRQFKSPKKAQDGSRFMVIPDRTLKQTIMIYNFHEGGSFLKILKHGNNYEIWEVQEDSLKQRLNNVEVISATRIKFDNKTFVKINPPKKEDTYQILEEILFKGQYTNSDGQLIYFKPNGQLIGLDNFKYYNPIIDYFDAAMQVDQVGLGSSQQDIDWYGFKFNKDTLELYKLNCLTFDSTDKRCVEVEFGQLTYKLWRKE